MTPSLPDPAPAPLRIAERLAPDGLVFETWVADRRLRRTPIPAAKIAQAHELAAADGDLALQVRSAGERATLVIYDGDSGEWVGSISA